MSSWASNASNRVATPISRSLRLVSISIRLIVHRLRHSSRRREHIRRIQVRRVRSEASCQFLSCLARSPKSAASAHIGGANTTIERDLARLFQSLAGVTAAQPQRCEGGVEALLFHRNSLEDPVHHGHHVRSDPFRPGPDPDRVPLPILLALGLVDIVRPVLVHDMLTKQQVAGGPLVIAVNLHQLAGDA